MSVKNNYTTFTMKFLILSFLAVALTTATSDHSDFRIVGGVKAEKGEWPWHLALWVAAMGPSEQFYTCGASIVGPTWGVTAAHCMNEATNKYSVRAGMVKNTANCSQTGECLMRTLTKAVKHENFINSGSKGYPNDIAYIEWKEPIQEVENSKLSIKYITRATKDNQIGMNCYITGFGRIGPVMPSSVDLLEAKFDVITKEECDKLWGNQGKITDTQVCVLDRNATSSGCAGDSGGPLVCEVSPKKWELVGATSWGSGNCSPSVPGVWTRISSFNKWLDALAPK